MRRARWWALTGSAALIVSLAAVVPAAAAAHPTPPPRSVARPGRRRLRWNARTRQEASQRRAR